jgi:hypothetical protein
MVTPELDKLAIKVISVPNWGGLAEDLILQAK